MIACGVSFGILSTRSILANGGAEAEGESKWAGSFDNARYYSLLVPLTVPTAIVFVSRRAGFTPLFCLPLVFRCLRLTRARTHSPLLFR